MRFVSAGIVVGSLLFASLAFAAEGKGGNDSGKGGPGPGGGQQTASGGTETGVSGTSARTGEATATEEEEAAANPDKADPFAKAYKAWEVGVIFTTHRLVMQNDLAGGYAENGSPDTGAGAEKMINDYEAYVRYDITKHDRVSVRAYMYEHFMADNGETGVRLDDTVFAYTHSIPLPKRFNLDLSLWLTAPTSFDSYLAGTVTSPRVVVAADRRFGPVSIDARVSGTYDIQTEESYSLSAGGAPTSLAHISLGANAELHMPFYEPLSAGIGLATGYNWYHNIANQQPSVNYPFTTQPIQQSYGGEVFVRYLIPMLVGFKPDITLAYAMGDATIGYTNVLHDGVGHLYLGYRENSEFYLSLAVRY